MKQILIVDDEYFVRLGIKASVDWEENDYKIVGEAENGIEAVEKIMSLEPQIVLLDITMPSKSGLEVLEEVRKNGYKGYIIMLTCHKEFDLIQQAIRLGADDYVLKNELYGENMLDYIKRIPKEKIEFSNPKIDEEEEDIKDKKYFKVNFLKNFLRFGGITKEQLKKSQDRYGVSVRGDEIYFIVIKIHKLKKILQRYEEGSTHILFQTIESMVSEQVKNIKEKEHFWMDADTYILMITFTEEPSLFRRSEIINGIVNQLEYSFNMLLNIDTAIAISKNCYCVEEVSKTYFELLQLLEQKYFYPEMKIFKREMFGDNIQSLELVEDLEKQEDELVGEHLLAWIEKNKREKMFFLKEEFLNRIVKIFYLVYEKYGIELDADLKDIEDENDLKEILKTYAQKVEKSKEINSHSYLVTQAIKIINEELQGEIMQEDVAERLGVSASYFSRTFSKEMEQSFSSYIIEKRIEKAKNLILTTNLKQYEIAEMSGFHSSVHFNNMFKKVCGITPNQFRNEKA